MKLHCHIYHVTFNVNAKSLFNLMCSCQISEKAHPSSRIHMLHLTLPDDVQEAYNLIQDLVPTTPQVMTQSNIEF